MKSSESIPLMHSLAWIHPTYRTIILAHLDPSSTKAVCDGVKCVLKHRYEDATIKSHLVEQLKANKDTLRSLIATRTARERKGKLPLIASALPFIAPSLINILMRKESERNGAGKTSGSVLQTRASAADHVGRVEKKKGKRHVKRGK